MTPEIRNVLLMVSGSWALSVTIKATLVMAFGLVVFRLARGARAAVRHSTLAATLGVVAALPVISVIEPPLSIAMKIDRPIPRPTANAIPRSVRPMFLSAPQCDAYWTAGDWLIVAWSLGAMVFLVPVFAGIYQVVRLRRSGILWPQGEVIAGSLAREMTIRRNVPVLLHEELTGPMTCGIAQAAIVLPSDATTWSSEELSRALVHELEHVARWDWPVHCASRLVCAFYWFHPLVWMLRRRLELEAERACDDAVISRSEPATYADQLVSIAQRLSTAARPPMLAMATRADLHSRLRAVLDSRLPRGRAGRLRVAVTLVVAVVITGAVSPLRISAAPQSTPASNPNLPHLRVESKLVLVEATVTYASGAPVEGLAMSDFVVTEDGAEQPIRISDFDKGKGVYLLGYYSPNNRRDGEFRRINVVVKTATSAKVAFRTGYFMTWPQQEAETRVAPALPGPKPYDTPPTLLFKKEPEYSDAARQAKYQGVVLLAVEVDTDGRVDTVRVMRSLGLGLDEKAIDAVKQWRFRPGTKDGKPIRVATVLEVSFRLL